MTPDVPPADTQAAPQPPKKAPDSPTGSSEGLESEQPVNLKAELRRARESVEQLRLRNQELTQQRNEASRHADEGWFKAGEADTARMQAEARNQTMREERDALLVTERYVEETDRRASLYRVALERARELALSRKYHALRNVIDAALSEPAEPEGAE